MTRTKRHEWKEGKQSQSDRKKGINSQGGMRREGGEAAMRDDQAWCLKW